MESNLLIIQPVLDDSDIYSGLIYIFANLAFTKYQLVMPLYNLPIFRYKVAIFSVSCSNYSNYGNN